MCVCVCVCVSVCVCTLSECECCFNGAGLTLLHKKLHYLVETLPDKCSEGSRTFVLASCPLCFLPSRTIPGSAALHLSSFAGIEGYGPSRVVISNFLSWCVHSVYFTGEDLNKDPSTVWVGVRMSLYSSTQKLQYRFSVHWVLFLSISWWGGMDMHIAKEEGREDRRLNKQLVKISSRRHSSYGHCFR